jgi:nucleoside-diphosphate-sugar epimerase
MVSGAEGLLGGALVEAARAVGAEVEALPGRRGGFDLRQTDRLQERLRATMPEVFVHCAALSHPGRCAEQPELARELNGELPGRIAQVLPPGCRLVQISTCHVHGRPESLPLRADSPLRPEGVYAQSKALGEELVLARRPDSLILRPFHLYGPMQSTDYALASWVEGAARGELRVGDLRLRRDYLHVDDAAEAVLCAVAAALPGPLLICSGRAPPLAHWAEALSEALATPLQVEPGRLRAGELEELRGDSDPLRLLGWSPRRDLAQELVRRALARREELRR